MRQEFLLERHEGRNEDERKGGKEKTAPMLLNGVAWHQRLWPKIHFGPNFL